MDNDLNSLTEGMAIPYGGDKVAFVSAELADLFSTGDHLIVVQTTGDLLHIPRGIWSLSQEAVGNAYTAFTQMGAITDEAITAFYEAFARYLEQDDSFELIAEANSIDVQEAKSKERSTTR